MALRYPDDQSFPRMETNFPRGHPIAAQAKRRGGIVVLRTIVDKKGK